MRDERIILLQPWISGKSYDELRTNQEFLGFCEGVVGIVSIENLRFDEPIDHLSDPVMKTNSEFNSKSSLSCSKKINDFQAFKDLKPSSSNLKSTLSSFDPQSGQ